MNDNKLYADGGVITHNPSEIGGTWAYRILKDGLVTCEFSGILTPKQAKMVTVSNNLTEMCAVIAGLRALPDDWTGTIYSDSQITLGRLFMSWKWNEIPQWLHDMYKDAQKRLVNWERLTWVLLDGHPTKAHLAAGLGKRGHPVSEHNKWCDQACTAAAKHYLEQLQAKQEKELA
jgi:ribonuclease HI